MLRQAVRGWFKPPRPATSAASVFASASVSASSCRGFRLRGCAQTLTDSPVKASRARAKASAEPRLATRGWLASKGFLASRTRAKSMSGEFGRFVFCATKMHEALSAEEFKDWEEAVREQRPMQSATTQAIASALARWALSHGATHYTHWFQPLTGRTAEIHQTFFDLKDTAGFGASAREKWITAFGRDHLFHGEADGSSFPTGGLRTTDAARALTSWDPSSPPFLVFGGPGQDKTCTLYLPAVFYSHLQASDDWTAPKGGRLHHRSQHPEREEQKTLSAVAATVALDHKIPLLRSIRALTRSTQRFLEVLGQEHVMGAGAAQHAGIEQEFFLVDRSLFLRRPDLQSAGRVLLGSPEWRHQQFSDHYFGPMSERALAFHHELEHTCWSLGIALKIRHREVCPGQYEVAPRFAHASLAVDQNLLLCMLLPRVARRHGFSVLLHEKPFPGVNGSGKHNNWSFGTEHVPSLLNAKFLHPSRPLREQLRTALLFTAFFKAVDEQAPLLRLSISGAGNDHRLGGFEAPPSVLSVCVGDEISRRLSQLFGVDPVPGVDPKCLREKRGSLLEGSTRVAASTHVAGSTERVSFSLTDRNRTSPIAFNGNKFEFRAVGASQNPSISTQFLNAAMAHALSALTESIAEQRRQAPGDSIEACARRVGKHVFQRHERVVFNGNGYAPNWLSEAKRRGLPHFSNTLEVLTAFAETLAKTADTPTGLDDSVRHTAEKMLAETGVCSPAEFAARLTVCKEEYELKTKVEANFLLSCAGDARHVLAKETCPTTGERPRLYHQLWDAAARVERAQGGGQTQAHATAHSPALSINSSAESLPVASAHLRGLLDKAKLSPDGSGVGAMPSCFKLLHSTLD